MYMDLWHRPSQASLRYPAKRYQMGKKPSFSWDLLLAQLQQLRSIKT